MQNVATKPLKHKNFTVQFGEEFHEFNKDNVPEMVRSWRMWKAVQRRQSAECFYTGEDCIIRTKNTNWTVTEEHLVPKSRGGFRQQGNIVIAASWVNNMLGNAPLQVKIEVKKQLDKISCHPKLDFNARKKIYAKVIRASLKPYEINNRFPWNEFPKNTSEFYIKKFENAIKQLKVEENKFIRNYLKKCKNIEKTIEQMIRRM